MNQDRETSLRKRKDVVPKAAFRGKDNDERPAKAERAPVDSLPVVPDEFPTKKRDEDVNTRFRPRR